MAWCEPGVTPAVAKAVRDAAKAKYDSNAWQGIAAPLEDALRDRKRAALVDYLTARPSQWNGGVTTADADNLSPTS